MNVREVKEGDLVLARYVPAGEAWSGGLNFFSPDDDFIQVGTWGYESGKELKAHIHNEVPREVRWTQEVLYVRRGRILAHVFDTSEREVAKITAGEGDLLMMLRGGHGYEILEDGTQVLEVKNGPYVGPERDRRRI